MTVTFKGEQMVVSVKGDDKTAKVKVDSSKSPATIDISPAEGPEKGKTFPGIYKVEKGELTLVFTEKGDRPKEFKVEGEAVLLKLKRDKEEKK
jgi:uncharacterized protein (TIGR03067 family)